MDNLNDLKAIWLSADTSGLPGADEIKVAAKKYRDSKLFKTTWLVLAAIFLTLTEVWVWFIYPSILISTRIGEVCMILAGLILVTTNLNTLNRFYKNKDLNNRDFIQFLEKTRQRQLFYHQKTQVVAFTLAAVGLLFYQFEIVYHRLFWAVVAYSITILFLLVMWLLVRKRKFNQESMKLNKMIEKMKELSGQF